MKMIPDFAFAIFIEQKDETETVEIMQFIKSIDIVSKLKSKKRTVLRNNPGAKVVIEEIDVKCLHEYQNNKVYENI